LVRNRFSFGQDKQFVKPGVVCPGSLFSGWARSVRVPRFFSKYGGTP
jgi:hypothetical protein